MKRKSLVVHKSVVAVCSHWPVHLHPRCLHTTRRAGCHPLPLRPAPQEVLPKSWRSLKIGGQHMMPFPPRTHHTHHTTRHLFCLVSHSLSPFARAPTFLGRPRGETDAQGGRQDRTTHRGSNGPARNRRRPQTKYYSMPGTRCYVGNLCPSISAEDLRELFRVHGPIDRVDMKKDGFAFVEYMRGTEGEQAVISAMQALDGREVHGVNITVQEAKGPKRDGPKPPMQRSDHRVRVEGMPHNATWQDLKDFARGKIGLAPLYTEVVRPGLGIIEYHRYDDMMEALRIIHNTELRGTIVQVYEVRGWKEERKKKRERRDRDKATTHLSHSCTR